jgi:MFS family permease
MAPSSTGGQGPYGILRNRDFFYYLLGRLSAFLGFQMLTVAVGWELYERTQSALNLGFVGLTQFLPMLVMTLPAGHLADTLDRKRIIIGMEFLLASSSLGLMVNSWSHANVLNMYLCLLASGVGRTFLGSASASFLPQLVSREEFPRAVNWSTSAFQFSAVTGPAIGGAIIALAHSAAPVYTANMVLQLLCLTMVLVVRTHHRPALKEPFSLRALLGGFRFVFGHRIILGTITLDLFAVLFGGATALLPIYAKDILHAGPQGLGLLQGALPAGSLACAIYMAHRLPLERSGRALTIAVSIFGLATIVFGFSHLFWLSMLMLFVCGAADTISVIVRHTLVQLLTPDPLRGRVSAVNNLFIGASNDLGGFESGLTSFWVNPVFSVVFGGVATILAVVAVAWIWPEIPRYGRLVQPVREPVPAAAATDIQPAGLSD